MYSIHHKASNCTSVHYTMYSPYVICILCILLHSIAFFYHSIAIQHMYEFRIVAQKASDFVINLNYFKLNYLIRKNLLTANLLSSFAAHSIIHFLRLKTSFLNKTSG